MFHSAATALYLSAACVPRVVAWSKTKMRVISFLFCSIKKSFYCVDRIRWEHIGERNLQNKLLLHEALDQCVGRFYQHLLILAEMWWNKSGRVFARRNELTMMKWDAMSSINVWIVVTVPSKEKDKNAHINKRTKKEHTIPNTPSQCTHSHGHGHTARESTRRE